MKIEASDRRYAVFECSNCYVGGADYFKRLRSVLNDTNAAILFAYLSKYDISKWDRTEIPKTAVRNEIKMNSTSLPIRFLIDLVKGEKIEAKVKFSKLFHKFKVYCYEQWEVELPE